MDLILSTKTREANQLLRPLASYLYKNLAGAFETKKVSNTIIIKTLVLYQIPLDIRRKYGLNDSEFGDVNEMVIDINLTTYGSVIRVNLIEAEPEDLTLGCKTFDVTKSTKFSTQEYFADVQYKVWKYLQKRLINYYKDYDFLF